MQLKLILILCVITANLLIGCASRSTPPAPIVNITHAPEYANNSTSSRASNGNLDEDNGTTLGSVNQNTQKHQFQNPTVTTNQNQEKYALIPPNSAKEWVNPTNGTINKTFNFKLKGVDYTGVYGQDIYAINDGKVVYSGNGLKGYGNLIIIKHDKMYLSAYANNTDNLVKEGDMVKRGQKIATMGKGANGKPLLHFEVRQNGKPIDPSVLLK